MGPLYSTGLLFSETFFIKSAGFPLRKAFRIGLFLKIFLLSSAVSLISLVGGYWLLEKQMVSRVSRILKSESQLVLDQLAHAVAIPIISDDRLTINDLLRTFSLQNGVKEIFVKGKDGKILGDSIKGHPLDIRGYTPSKNGETKIFFTTLNSSIMTWQAKLFFSATFRSERFPSFFQTSPTASSETRFSPPFSFSD